MHHYLARPSLPPFFCAMTDCLTEWESSERGSLLFDSPPLSHFASHSLRSRRLNRNSLIFLPSTFPFFLFCTVLLHT